MLLRTVISIALVVFLLSGCCIPMQRTIPKTNIIPPPTDAARPVLQKIGWMGGVLVGVFVLGIACFVFKNYLLGMAMIAGSLSGIWLLVTLDKHENLIGIVGLIALVVGAGWFIYSTRETIWELIATNEFSKGKLDLSDQLEFKDTANTLQSSKTKKIVHEFRKG